MMAFIEQEAKEKVEEIDAKVSKEEIVNVSFIEFRIIESNGMFINSGSDVTRQSGDWHEKNLSSFRGDGEDLPVFSVEINEYFTVFDDKGQMQLVGLLLFCQSEYLSWHDLVWFCWLKN